MVTVTPALWAGSFCCLKLKTPLDLNNDHQEIIFFLQIVCRFNSILDFLTHQITLNAQAVLLDIP